MGFIPENIAKQIRGKRYVCRVRCSTDPQSDTSIPAQLEDLHHIGDSCGGTAAGNDIVLPALSGSKPGNQTDIQESIKRKHEVNDFDVILNVVEDRFTRAGAEQGFWAQRELLRNGIGVVYVRSDIPAGPHEATIRSMKFEAARETAKNTSLRSTGGSQRALENGNICTSSHTNYGLYRKYLTASGEPLHLIRDMRDGTQQKLHHETRELLEIYGTVGGRSAGHFKKQKSDRVVMVSGDEKEVSAIKLIHERKWIDGRGGRRISNELRALNIPAPEGGGWTQRQVDVIAENPIYCGWGIANLHTSAIFHKRSKNGPIPVEVDEIELATRPNLRVKLRPPEEWTIKEEPELKNFLPQPLRDIASAKIKALWERRARGEVAPRVRNTHLDSLYILTGLIRAAHDGRLLKGQNNGPHDKATRSYAHPIARKDPVAAGCPNTTFTAEPLEKPVVATLGESLMAMPDLRDELRLAVEAVVNSQKPRTPHSIEDLKRQLDAVSTKVKITLDVVNADTQDEAKVRLAELGRERRDLEQQLRDAQATQDKPLDVEAVTDSLMVRLQDLGNQLESLPVYQLRQVLAQITDSMTADMFTREVVMNLRLPGIAISNAKTPLSELCLQTSSQSPTGSQAQKAAALVLAKIRCEYERVGGRQCFRCQRVKNVA